MLGLLLGIVLVIVLRRAGALKREQRTWHLISRAWYAFLPLGLSLTVAGLCATLGFQWAALETLEKTGRPLCDNVATVTFYLMQALMKGGLVPDDVKTESDLVRWSTQKLEPILEAELEKTTGSQKIVLKAARPLVFAAAHFAATELIHGAFEAASEKSGLPPEQVRDAAIGLLEAGTADSEKAVADGLLKTLLQVARGLIFHGYLFALIPLGVVAGAFTLDSLVHLLWRRRRAA
jgi:hypothetical protein